MAAAVAAAAATTILPPQTSNEQVETTSTETTDNTTTSNSSSHHHPKDSTTTCSYCEETERAILRLSPIIGEKSRVDEEENESVINVDEYLDLDADDEQQLTSSYSNLSSINHPNHTTKRRTNNNTTTLRNTNMSTNILMTRSNNKLKYYRSITDMSSCGSSGRFAATNKTNKRYDLSTFQETIKHQ